MKKFFILILTLCFSLVTDAKSTYIAHYHTSIYVETDNSIDSISGITPEVCYSGSDSIYITVVHELLDKNRIRAIKHAKAAAGWAGLSAGLSTFSAMTTSNPFHYYNSAEMAKSSASASASASDAAEVLQNLGIAILVENNSEKEIYVNDMEKGNIWYIAPKTYVWIPMTNPLATQLRVAYSYPEMPCKKYVQIVAESQTEKREVGFEDDEIIMLEKTVRNARTSDRKVLSYTLINKETYVEETIPYDVFDKMADERKDRAKAFAKKKQ